MAFCSVPGCKASKKNNTQDYSFHQFPIIPDIRGKDVDVK